MKRDIFADILRITALLMVLSVHIVNHLANVPQFIHKLFSLGAYGVALYFLISGYLSFPAVSKTPKYGGYIRGKGIRILPMYYLSLLFTFIVDALILKRLPIDWKWVLHILFLNMFIPSSEWDWWHSVNFFWTMPCFIAWYILSPFIFRICRNSKGLFMITLFSACATPLLKSWMYTFANEQFVNWNFFCLLYNFLLGALAWFVIHEHKQLIGIVYGLVIGVSGFVFDNKSGFLVFGLFFYFMILIFSFLHADRIFRNQTVNKIIITLSSSTYAVYLFHYFIICAFSSILGVLPWILSYFLFITISFCVGIFLLKYIEDPIKKLLTK